MRSSLGGASFTHRVSPVPSPEIHAEIGGNLPLQRTLFAGEGRVLVQHGIGRIFAFGDLQHAREGAAPLILVDARGQPSRELVYLRVGPFLRLLLLSLRPVLGDVEGLLSADTKLRSSK